MSSTFYRKYKYFHSTVQTDEDKQQKIHFWRFPFGITSCLISLMTGVHKREVPTHKDKEWQLGLMVKGLLFVVKDPSPVQPALEDLRKFSTVSFPITKYAVSENHQRRYYKRKRFISSSPAYQPLFPLQPPPPPTSSLPCPSTSTKGEYTYPLLTIASLTLCESIPWSDDNAT